MVSRLDVLDRDIILEPCAGSGVFVQKIIDMHPDRTYTIEALDINPKAIDFLQDNFQQPNIAVRQTDTLFDAALESYSRMGGYYTKIIGNPPYGAWQNYDKRSTLKKCYGGHVRETYTLFIRRAIDLLQDGGKLVFIVPDTFLALHVHKDTREKILTNTLVEEVTLIPSHFFPGVNFGYANLCIITLKKIRSTGSHKIKVVKINKNIDTLYEITNLQYSSADEYEEIPQNEVIEGVDYSFLLGGDKNIRNLINNNAVTLGDIADCVTGFCSGDNTAFYRPLHYGLKNTKRYDLIANTNDIEFDVEGITNLLDGLSNGKTYIPIIKGTNPAFTTHKDWFVQWDKTTVEFYRRNKKSRFQNSQYYFREGIGMPMVKSRKTKAFLLDKQIFDQSVVGIFPKQKEHLYYLLAFLNSDVCNHLIKAINHTANNSANYLKKIPIIISPEYIDEVNRFVRDILENKNTHSSVKQINTIFNRLYSID